MSLNPDSLMLAGIPIEPRGHVCAFFNSADEEFDVLVPFIKDGIDHADKFWYIIDPVRRVELIRRLQQAGLDPDALTESGHLDLHPWEAAHLRGGSFDKEAMLNFLDLMLTSNETQGFPLTRIWSNQEWALGDSPGALEIVEYEARFNYVAEKHAGLTVCVFDLSQFSGNIVMDMLRTHPLVILGGILHENPFYTPPTEFLRELSLRKSSAGA